MKLHCNCTHDKLIRLLTNVAGLLGPRVCRALRLVIDWHKYACQYEFRDEDVRAMQHHAQRYVHVTMHLSMHPCMDTTN